MLNIIVADDHEFIREAVTTYLQGIADEVSILEASSYGEVLNLARRADEFPRGLPLAIIDLKMPGFIAEDRFAGIRKIRQALPDTAVVILSADEDGPTIAEAIACGVRGYVPKTMRGQSLVNALKLVLADEIYVPPILTKHVAKSVEAPAVPDGAEALLSPRELACIRLLTEGMSNKHIARKLELQVVTVKMHLRNAYKKLGAGNRVEAVRRAIELQIDKGGAAAEAAQQLA